MGNLEIIGCRLLNNQTVKGVRFDCIKYNLFLLLGEHSVLLRNLVEPRETHRVRNLDRDHVVMLETKLKDGLGSSIMMVANVQCEKDQFDPAVPQKYEVIGGNHTRAAFQRIHPNGNKEFIVKVYCNLTYEEALYLGIQHNKEKENSGTYYDLVCRYRMVLKCVGGKEICKNVEPDVIKAWKAKLTLVPQNSDAEQEFC